MVSALAGVGQAQNSQVPTPSPSPAPAPSAASTPGATGRDQSPAAQPVTAADRLATASKMLGDIQDRELKPEAKDLLAQLKKHFSEMVSLNAKAEAKAEDKVIERPIPETAPVGTSGTKSDGEKRDWKDRFSEVEGDLTSMIGGGSSSKAPAAGSTPGAGMKDLPADVTQQLNDFRIQLELFYAASMGQSMSNQVP